MNDVEELAQRIAQAITSKAMIAKDIANPAAYTDKILQSLVAKHAKRGTGWLVEQGIEHGLVIPETWDCPRCGFPAGQDPENPPSPPRVEPYKTHLAYVKERRSDAEGEVILDEALEALRHRGLIQ